MKRLELEFYRRTAPPRWAGWLLLLVTLAFAGDLARSYVTLQADIQAKEERLARLDRSTDSHWVRVSSTPPSAEELDFAADTIRRLATPWNALFHALEGAQSKDITLLAVDPDPDSGSVVVTGSARDYTSILGYVSALAAQPALKRVRLQKYETTPADPQRPLSFTISAAWRRPR